MAQVALQQCYFAAEAVSLLVASGCSGINRDLQCLGTDLFDEPFLQPDEFRRGLDLVGSRVGQIDRDLGLDAAGTGAHDDDAAAEENRLFDIMGDEQDGLLLAFPDAEQHFLHQHTGLIIQRPERFVEQQDLGIVGERAGDRRALLHAAGELLRPVIPKAGQADPMDESIGDLAAVRLGYPALAQAERDVFAHRQPREQRVRLKHHAAIGAGSRDLVPVQDDAAAGRPVKPGDDPQQRGFSATRRAEDGDEVVVADAEVGRLQRARRRIALARRENAGDLIDLQLGHANLHGNSQALKALNRKSDTSPISPMTMMPKMIWPVLSSAWLSVIMWPMPDDEPISPATIT